jgi:hypothetical protein
MQKLVSDLGSGAPKILRVEIREKGSRAKISIYGAAEK